MYGNELAAILKEKISSGSHMKLNKNKKLFSEKQNKMLQKTCSKTQRENMIHKMKKKYR